MKPNYLSCFILFLLFIVIGMIIGQLFPPKYEYHGPNAKKQTKKIYYDQQNDKYIKFDIIPTSCPKNKLNNLYETFISVNKKFEK